MELIDRDRSRPTAGSKEASGRGRFRKLQFCNFWVPTQVEPQRFLAQLEIVATLLRVDLTDRSYRNNFTPNYRVLFDRPGPGMLIKNTKGRVGVDASSRGLVEN